MNVDHEDLTSLLDAGVPAFNEWREQEPEAVVTFVGMDLSGRDLRGINLANAKLARADLSNCELGDAILDDVSGEEISLAGARLQHASLQRAHLVVAVQQFIQHGLADKAGGTDEGDVHGVLQSNQVLMELLFRLHNAPISRLISPGLFRKTSCSTN